VAYTIAKIFHIFQTMLATTTTATTSFVATYDQNGKIGAFLRSQPAQPFANVADQGSTTAEKYQDKVTLSADGLAQSRPEAADSGSPEQTGRQQSPALELTTAEEKMVRQLRERDREVKNHEMAHLANAGQYARGGPTYSYQQGPDGRRYAVGGEVPIDLSQEKTPEQTLQKMRAVRRAALAPTEPSAADRSIAATAAALESQARHELRGEQATPDQEQAGHDTSAGPKNEKSEAITEETNPASSRRHAQDLFA
jgi:hypothetical protein